MVAYMAQFCLSGILLDYNLSIQIMFHPPFIAKDGKRMEKFFIQKSSKVFQFLWSTSYGRDSGVETSVLPLTGGVSDGAAATTLRANAVQKAQTSST